MARQARTKKPAHKHGHPTHEARPPSVSAVLRVHRVDARRMDLHPHLTLTGGRGVDIANAENIWGPEAIDYHGPHRGRCPSPLRNRGASLERLNLDAVEQALHLGRVEGAGA